MMTVAPMLRRAALVALTASLLLPNAAIAAAGPTLLDVEVGDAKAGAAAAADAPAGATPTSAATSVLPAAAPAAPVGRSYPYVELHGYFRFRPDLISNGHLGQAVSSSLPQYPVITASSIKPPLSRWPQNNDASNGFSAKVGNAREEDSVSGATMRLRLQPTIHVAETVRLRLTVDVFDNYTFGANPDYSGALARPDVPLVAFGMSTTPGSVRVVEAYGEWKTLLGLIRVGRQASNWGLGVLANGGMGSTWDGGRPLPHFYGGNLGPAAGLGYDADFGNYSDRAAFVTKVKGTYVAAFWDFISQGSLAYDPFRVDGVAYDMENGDDVNQWGLAIFRKPVSEEEIAERRRDLNDLRKSVLDWGFYGIYRTQDLDTNATKAAPSQHDATDAPKLTLLPRNAWVFAGDFWARFERRPSLSTRIVAEAEAVYLRGHIEDASPIGDASTQKTKEIEMWGGALKSAWQSDNITVSFDAGVASGDDTRCFGVYGAGNCGLDTASGDPNKQITGFKFHRNYRVDSLLFRDVIGAVTNTWYIKPTFGLTRQPWYAADELLGFDLGVLHAGAMNAEGTPGNGSTLGTEMEVRAFIGARNLYLAQVTFSYLLPGDALDVIGANDSRGQWLGATQTKPAENAWRLMARMVLMF
ncbi:MAG: TIGR04551 family protein [Deltaproteobacteria bacterium]|nr:TIGR04551 family protein [Deltaproteobacteria bacterium]